MVQEDARLLVAAVAVHTAEDLDVVPELDRVGFHDRRRAVLVENFRGKAAGERQHPVARVTLVLTGLAAFLVGHLRVAVDDLPTEGRSRVDAREAGRANAQDDLPPLSVPPGRLGALRDRQCEEKVDTGLPRVGAGLDDEGAALGVLVVALVEGAADEAADGGQDVLTCGHGFVETK